MCTILQQFVIVKSLLHGSVILLTDASLRCSGTWGTTVFYLPYGFAVHNLIVRENTSIIGRTWKDGMVYSHHLCVAGSSANISTLKAFVQPALVTITPPGLPPNGQTLNYIWYIGGITLHSPPRIEVWLCDSSCDARRFPKTVQINASFIL